MAWWTGKPCATDTCIQATYYNAILDKGELAWDCIFGSGGNPFPGISRAVADVTEICASQINVVRGYIEMMVAECGECTWASLGDPCQDSEDVVSGDTACGCDFLCLEEALDCLLEKCCASSSSAVPANYCVYVWYVYWDCADEEWSTPTLGKDCQEPPPYYDCDGSQYNHWIYDTEFDDRCYYFYEACTPYDCDVDDDCPTPPTPALPDNPFDCECAEGQYCLYTYQGHFECADGSDDGEYIFQAYDCVAQTCYGDSECSSPPGPPSEPTPPAFVTCDDGSDPVWVYDGVVASQCTTACTTEGWQYVGP